MIAVALAPAESLTTGADLITGFELVAIGGPAPACAVVPASFGPVSSSSCSLGCSIKSRKVNIAANASRRSRVYWSKENKIMTKNINDHNVYMNLLTRQGCENSLTSLISPPFTIYLHNFTSLLPAPGSEKRTTRDRSRYAITQREWE